MKHSVCALILFALSTVSGNVDPSSEFNNNIIENLFEEFQLQNVAEPLAQPTDKQVNTEYNQNIFNLLNEPQLLGGAADPSAEPSAEPTQAPSVKPSVGTPFIFPFEITFAANFTRLLSSCYRQLLVLFSAFRGTLRRSHCEPLYEPVRSSQPCPKRRS